VAHNVLVSHGAAVPVIRQQSAGAKVGIVIDFSPAYPHTDTEADRKATELHDQRYNRWFLDPIVGRGYPQLAWEDYGGDVPEVLPGDLERMAPPLDFLGINYYTRRVCHDPASKRGKVLYERDDDNVSDRDWEIYPQGLYDLLTRLDRDYDFETLYVTENGASYRDVVSDDGRIHDPKRIDFVRQHLEVMLQAIEKGVPLKGYFYWTLADNFEWAFGTSSRFGLAYTHFDTLERVLKDSGHWFGHVTRANAL
jgi:beta-glucosidase